MTIETIYAFFAKWNLKQKHFARLFGMSPNSVSRFLSTSERCRKIPAYYAKSFHFFSLLSEDAQQRAIEQVK